MLSSDQITALQDSAQTLVEPVVEWLISDIAERIAAAGQFTSTAQYEIWRAQNLGLSLEEIKKELRKKLHVTSGELEQLLRQVAKVGYDYDLSRLPTADAIPFEKNTSLQQIVDAAVKMVGEEMENLTQTGGFVCPDGIPRTLSDAYQNACDYAFKKTVTGAQDYVSAIRDATKGLTEKGVVAIDYSSGKRYTVEAAVRRSVVGGMGLIVEEVNKQNFELLGCDGWEVSAHLDSAPDHEPIQGKQYPDEEYQRLNNSLKRRISTLNCGHIAFPIIMGVNSPQYTPEELEQMRQENEKGVTYGGKHYTLYEATQVQRKLERAIRRQKRRILVDEATGDAEKLQTDQIRYQVLNQEYKRFSKATGQRMQYERMEVAGFTGKHGSAAEKTVFVIKTPQEKEASKTTPSNSVASSDANGKLPIMNGDSIKAPNIQQVVKTTIITDVVDEYIQKATPGMGEITFEEGYDKDGHPHEVTVAEWLKQKFGGNIVVQSESSKDGERRSDYLWNGKLWELKGPTTVKAPDSALRKGMTQILSNPGGIILDFKDSDISIDEALVTINNRMSRPESIETDVMIIHRGKLVKVLRYKK